jgi:cephalosporin-C deacetylase
MLRSLTPLLCLCAATLAAAQQPTFTPDDPAGIYSIGERVGWTVTAAAGAPMRRYTYAIKRDGGEVLSSGTLDLSRGSARIETTLDRPAMVLVEVRPEVADRTFGDRSTGGPGRVLLGAAVDPTGIRAAEPEPEDFDAFWTEKLRQLEAVPTGAEETPKESGVEGVEYATVRMNNIGGAHVYAQLAKPAGAGKFPALIIFQWAGGPYPLQKEWVTNRARQGWLVLNVMPHDVPSDLPSEFYASLPTLVKRYHTIGQHSRDESHFLPMYLGDYRAVEYLAGRPEWDRETMVVMGTSMGGQQSFATAGLNPRVTGLLVHVPAGADVTAGLHGRDPSYPDWNVSRADVLETARYFDPVNFADRITASSLISMGFLDEIAAPTGIWAVFNRIPSPKTAVPMPNAHHNNLATAEQQRAWTVNSEEWLATFIQGGDPMALPLAGGTREAGLAPRTRSGQTDLREEIATRIRMGGSSAP